MTEPNCSFQHSALRDPLGARENRQNRGKTMVIDKGMGLRQFEDVLETAAPYIDFVKLGFGTAALYPEPILRAKLTLAEQFQVALYPGGTYFEVAYKRGETARYFEEMKRVGFTKIEISDGTVEVSPEDRALCIRLAKEMDFDVITEYGKKIAGSQIEAEGMLRTIRSDLATGASHVIIEGRESGENVGIYQSCGEIQSQFKQIAEAVDVYRDMIIWEAPKKRQQVELMEWFGPNVHLGNIAPQDVFSVESLRRGLRSDTFFLEI